ncbi:RNA polymerase sigma factor [Pedobacter nyackensis]|uniref:RNA polymerase sigma-70 factor, ECF subfamily n=1 Tax=Pedobacter nyackensis TaxID=475255 RepID=A0A1W2F9Q9_9SPHI|nr:RNA polymerase sigma factor [Pedobacter nyackensis]SMD18660.1 RNA polymerase sigma-70 factor, ECF subfamily [Pedobacter nyackensis]
MKEVMDFSRQLFAFKDSLHHFAFLFTKNEDDANDLVQDTMLKAIRHSEKFEAGTSMRRWLYIILKNTFINNYRKNNKLKNFKAESLQRAEQDFLNNSSTNDGEGKCILEDIHKVLGKLPYEYYYPFIRYFEGYKYHEIAKELDIPLGTVKTRIHCARIFLKHKLKVCTAFKKFN